MCYSFAFFLIRSKKAAKRHLFCSNEHVAVLIRELTHPQVQWLCFGGCSLETSYSGFPLRDWECHPLLLLFAWRFLERERGDASRLFAGVGKMRGRVGLGGRVRVGGGLYRNWVPGHEMLPWFTGNMAYGEKEITTMPGELQNQPTADCDQEPGRICSRSERILSLRLVLATPLR